LTSYLALTSNELDIYTVHSDKSEIIHMEALYTSALQSEIHHLGNSSFLTPKEIDYLSQCTMALIIVGLSICFTQKINRKVLPKVCMLLWYVESVECLFCFCTEFKYTW